MDIKQRLAEIRARVEKATPGPWRPEREPPPCKGVWVDDLPDGSVPVESTGTAFALGVAVAASPRNEDATFIAHAREDVPMLLPLGEFVAECAEAPCADTTRKAGDCGACWPCRARAVVEGK